MPKAKGNDVTLSKMAEALVETNIALQHKVADLILNMKDKTRVSRKWLQCSQKRREHQERKV